MAKKTAPKITITMVLGIIITALVVFVCIAYWLAGHKPREERPLENYPGIVIPMDSYDEQPLYTPPFQKGSERMFCIQVVTPAYNPETGECVDFGTPCDVPPGWIAGSCVPLNVDIQTMSRPMFQLSQQPQTNSFSANALYLLKSLLIGDAF